jgi:hypothetical protein
MHLSARSRTLWSTRMAPTLIGISLLACAASSCQGRNAGQFETTTVGLPRLEQNALIYIADQQGFFAQNDVKVIIKDYVVLHPEQAKATVQKRLNYDDGYMASVWTEHHFALSLDYSLVVAMTDEVRWMIKNKLTTVEQPPDFLNSFYMDGLKRVKPEAVDLIR